MEIDEVVIKEVKDLGADLRKEIDNIKGQIKTEGQAKADSIKRFDEIEGKLNEYSEKFGQDLSTLATRVNQNNALFGERKESTETLKSQFEAALNTLKSEGFFGNIKGSKTIELGKGQNLLETKAVGDMGNANLNGYASRETRTGVIFDPVRPVRLRELISVTPMNAPVVEYPYEVGTEGGVGIQTEGSAKAQIDFDLDFRTGTPKTIAVFARTTMQSVEDIPYLASYLARRMSDKWYDFEDNQILNGNNTGNNFNGLLNQATAYTKTTGTGSTYFEFLADAMAQLKNTHYAPGGIVLNSLDLVRLVTYKSTDGTFNHPGLIYGPDGILRFFGAQIVESSAIARLTGLVGDMRQVDLAVRQALNFAVSYEDGNNFTTNKVTYRLEGREALLVYDAKAFRAINFAQIAS
ncbi:phage major capsid protein [Pedobacter sp.]|uniref:phage major capsid protein n=1 Tax=Pedobacter sp. TaxID=1411316 RepID=UPI003C3FA8B5